MAKSTDEIIREFIAHEIHQLILTVIEKYVPVRRRAKARLEVEQAVKALGERAARNIADLERQLAALE